MELENMRWVGLDCDVEDENAGGKQFQKRKDGKKLRY